MRRVPVSSLLAVTAVPSIALPVASATVPVIVGEDRLAARLIQVSGIHASDINLRDEKYHAAPLGWAIHGCYNTPGGNQGKQREVASMLVRAGATVEPEWLESQEVRADAGMLAALKTPL